VSASLRDSPAPAPPVTVSIERLVLDGLDLTPSQGALVQQAFERELARLIQQPGRKAHWAAGASPVATATPVHVGGAMHPARIGREVARSVLSTLRGAS